MRETEERERETENMGVNMGCMSIQSRNGEWEESWCLFCLHQAKYLIFLFVF
jgi:hypothetical protein